MIAARPRRSAPLLRQQRRIGGEQRGAAGDGGLRIVLDDARLGERLGDAGADLGDEGGAADEEQRAGSLDGAKGQDALAKTDLMTIGYRVKFDENHFNRTPIVFGQWQKTNTADKWKLEVIYSAHSFIPTTAQPIFPIPY